MIPSYFGFCGQSAIVKSLKSLIAAAKEKLIALPHILLKGAPGMGKSLLAKSIAADLETGFRVINCNNSITPIEILLSLNDLKKGDVVFFDEVHALNHKSIEALYTLLTDFKMNEIIDNKINPSKTIEIPPFTAIGATDQPEKLPKAFRSRMIMEKEFVPYTQQEIRFIVGNCASQNNLLINDQAKTLIGKASRGNPREITKIIKTISIQNTIRISPLTKTEVRSHLNIHFQIDNKNLKPKDREYLNYLRIHKFSSLKMLAGLCNCNEKEIEANVENYLLREGLISIQRQGRCLTEQGRKIIGGTK